MSAGYRTDAIVCRRVNYGEADRIVMLLTPQHGKVSVMARGVRKTGSKLAGGLELFSLCDVTIVPGKGQVGTLTSARLLTFYGDTILRDYDRLQLAYECLKLINRATETVPEPEFYDLLKAALQYLATPGIDWQLIEIWFRLRLSALLGAQPNLATDAEGQPLTPETRYQFDFEVMALAAHPNGRFGPEHIKFLRLAAAKEPPVLSRVSGVEAVMEDSLWLVRSFGG